MPGASGNHAPATMTSVDALQRFGFKLFLEPDAAVNVSTFIPVFHRWNSAWLRHGPKPEREAIP